MDRFTLIRRARIAASIVCLIPCGVLIALLVRSYSYYDVCDVHSGRSIMLRLVSLKGVVLIAPWVFDDSRAQTTFDYHGTPMAKVEANHARARKPPLEFQPWKMAKHSYAGGEIEYDLTLPHWFLAAVAAMLAGLPWIRWRFGLRTLLIACTMIAVILGIVVVASR